MYDCINTPGILLGMSMSYGTRAMGIYNYLHKERQSQPNNSYNIRKIQGGKCHLKRVLLLITIPSILLVMHLTPGVVHNFPKAVGV